MSIVLLGSTSGSCTLQEQAIAGTTTLTLPTTSGTVLTTASSISTSQLSGSIPRASLPAGSVLQVVSTEATAQSTTTSSSYANYSALNTSITPTSATSKILVTASLNLFEGSTNSNYQITLYRNSTDLGSGNGNGFMYLYGNNSLNLSFPAIVTYLDSPATTSSITYGIYGKTSSGLLYFNNGACRVSMILMEIAA